MFTIVLSYDRMVILALEVRFWNFFVQCCAFALGFDYFMVFKFKLCDPYSLIPSSTLLIIRLSALFEAGTN